MFYFQFRLKMRFPWQIHFEDQRCPYCSDCQTIFWQVFSWCSSICPLEPEAMSEARGQDILGWFVGDLVPFPLPSTGCWDQVAFLEIVTYWLGKLFQSPHFHGGLINSQLISSAEPSQLWIVWEGGETGQQTGALVILLAGEIYGPLYWNQWELQFMRGKKSILPRTVLKTSERR